MWYTFFKYRPVVQVIDSLFPFLIFLSTWKHRAVFQLAKLHCDGAWEPRFWRWHRRSPAFCRSGNFNRFNFINEFDLKKVNYPMIAANVHSSQLENVEASTVVNVKGRKVREYSWYAQNIFQDIYFCLIIKLWSTSKVGIIGYVTEQTPQKSQPGPETTFLPIIQSIRWNYKDLLLFCFLWYDSRRNEARRLKRGGAEILIALGHAGHGVGHGHWHSQVTVMVIGYGLCHGYSHSHG